MPMLASSLQLNSAPTQIASLCVVASTNAGGRMHNDGKSLNLGGFAYPPSCTPNHKKIAPVETRSPGTHIPHPSRTTYKPTEKNVSWRESLFPRHISDATTRSPKDSSYGRVESFCS